MKKILIKLGVNIMSKSKIPYNPALEAYSSEKPSEIRSSESEASDTEDVNQTDNLSADNSNTFISYLSTNSIDLNDDDDDDDKI